MCINHTIITQNLQKTRHVPSTIRKNNHTQEKNRAHTYHHTNGRASKTGRQYYDTNRHSRAHRENGTQRRK